MITAVDTSVLLDVIKADPVWLERSLAALLSASESGALIACEAVWAETIACFPDTSSAHDALAKIGLKFSAMNAEAASIAGQSFAAYKRSGGSRARVVADFLIGAHAQVQADRLLTRDRGFYRSCFHKLTVVEP